MNNVTVDEADMLWRALGRCTFVYIDVVCVCVCHSVVRVVCALLLSLLLSQYTHTYPSALCVYCEYRAFLLFIYEYLI